MGDKLDCKGLESSPRALAFLSLGGSRHYSRLLCSGMTGSELGSKKVGGMDWSKDRLEGGQARGCCRNPTHMMKGLARRGSHENRTEVEELQRRLSNGSYQVFNPGSLRFLRAEMTSDPAGVITGVQNACLH